jgi:hypothetical protein
MAAALLEQRLASHLTAGTSSACSIGELRTDSGRAERLGERGQSRIQSPLSYCCRPAASVAQKRVAAFQGILAARQRPGQNPTTGKTFDRAVVHCALLCLQHLPVQSPHCAEPLNDGRCAGRGRRRAPAAARIWTLGFHHHVPGSAGTRLFGELLVVRSNQSALWRFRACWLPLPSH